MSERTRAIVELLKSTVLSQRAIAEKHGVSPARVQQIDTRYGIRKPQRPTREQNRQNIFGRAA